MATTFVLGNGSTLSIQTSGSSTYVLVKQMKTVTYSGSKLDLEDITNLDSVGAYREYAPTLRDAGTVATEGVFAPADPGQIALTAAFDVSVPILVKHQLPPAAGQTTGILQTFAAYVAERPTFDTQADKTSSFKASLKITGPITTTLGS